MYFVVLCFWYKGILGVCIGSVYHQKSMVAHLVVFRSGLRLQLAGDNEEEEERNSLLFNLGRFPQRTSGQQFKGVCVLVCISLSIFCLKYCLI